MPIIDRGTIRNVIENQDIDLIRMVVLLVLPAFGVGQALAVMSEARRINPKP